MRTLGLRIPGSHPLAEAVKVHSARALRVQRLVVRRRVLVRREACPGGEIDSRESEIDGSRHVGRPT